MNRTQLYEKLKALKGKFYINNKGWVRSKRRKDSHGKPACPLNALLPKCISNLHMRSIRAQLGISYALADEIIVAVDANEACATDKTRKTRKKILELLGLTDLPLRTLEVT